MGTFKQANLGILVYANGTSLTGATISAIFNILSIVPAAATTFIGGAVLSDSTAFSSNFAFTASPKASATVYELYNCGVGVSSS